MDASNSCQLCSYLMNEDLLSLSVNQQQYFLIDGYPKYVTSMHDQQLMGHTFFVVLFLNISLAHAQYINSN